MTLPQQVFDNLQLSLSPERFEAHRATNNNDIETLTRYVWNIELCNSFYPLLQNLEIGFRNGLHYALAKHFSDDLWLVNQRRIFGRYDQATIDKARQELIRNSKPIVAGRLIAELNFGFWTGLLSNRYERIFWNKPQIYNNTFQNLPVRLRNRQILADRFNDIRRFRNRIFHHERILHRNLPQTHNLILDTIRLLGTNLLKTTQIIDRFPTVFLQDYFNKLKSKLEIALK